MANAKGQRSAGTGRSGSGGSGTSIADVLGCLNSARQTGPGQWTARCPAHDDEHPSLSVTEADGKPLLHCFAGCSQDEVWNALGLPKPGRNGQGDWTAFYTYATADGSPVLQVRRTEDKRFVAFVPDGGHWKTGAGVTKGLERPLYRLPEVLASSGRVYFTEGEKDADNLAGRGLTATCNPFGALTGKGARGWSSTWGDALKGRDVVALQDNDAAGAAHVQTVAKGLQGVARSIRVLALPGLPPGGDVSDWLGTHSTDELERLADSAPVWEAPTNTTAPERLRVTWQPDSVTAAQLLTLTLPDVRWAVSRVLPEGLAVLAGAPKAGKSWLALGIACAVASGGAYIGQATRQGHVLGLFLEDTKRRLQTRLKALGLAPEALELVMAWPRADAGGLEALDEYLARIPTALVVVDTWAKFRPPRQPGADVYEADYLRVASLKDLADKHGATVLLLHHTRKAESPDFLAAVSGSHGLTGAADSVLVLQRTRGQADATLHVTGRDVEETSMALALQEGRWQYLGTADEYATTAERRAVLDFLKEGPATVRDVADALGLSYDNAKKRLRRMEQAGLVVTDGGKYTARGSIQTMSPLSLVSPVPLLSPLSPAVSGTAGTVTRQGVSPSFVQTGTGNEAYGDSRDTPPTNEDNPATWPSCGGCERLVPLVNERGLCPDCEGAQL